MLDQVLKVFQVDPHYDLNAMRPGQTLTSATSLILSELEPVLKADRPDLVLVQGDTATTLAGALAAFYSKIPVGHIEAGLRTGDMAQPFPEEMNRVVVSRLSSLHFAATPWAAENLRREGIDASRTTVTGNTGMTQLFIFVTAWKAERSRGHDWPNRDSRLKLIVVTAHRRESFGEGFEQISQALLEIADLPDVNSCIRYIPNPNVSGPVHRNLAGHPHIRLVEPLDYISFIDLMRRAYLILTDSGGIQEEAPSFGKPVLVLREKTERPEAVEAGTATLVGTEVRKIVDCTRELVQNACEYERRRKIQNPYGDGMASGRIARFILACEGLLGAAG